MDEYILFVPRKIGMGLVLDEGLGLVVVEEEPDSRRRVECPFTVEPGPDGLPAGALLDMGRTSGLNCVSPESKHVWAENHHSCNSDSLGIACGIGWKARSEEEQTLGSTETVNVLSRELGQVPQSGRFWIGGQSLVRQKAAVKQTRGGARG